MSDLQFALSNPDLLIGYAGGSESWRSDLVDEHGHPLPAGTQIHVSGLFVQDGSEALQWRLQDIANDGTLAFSDPATLFLDRLYEVVVTAQESLERVPRVLQMDGSTYLLPFSSELLSRFPGVPIRIAEQNAPISADAITVRGRSTDATLDVELWLPVQHGRFVRARRRFDRQNELRTAQATPYFLLWPDFQTPEWRDYFFFSYSSPHAQLDLEPMVVTDDHFQRRRSDGARSQWWRASEPVTVIAAKTRADGAEAGLLIGPFVSAVDSPNRRWELSVDLGSTHTRIFSLEGSGTPRELALKARAVQLTGGSEQPFHHEFFRLRGSLPPALVPMVELPTQVITPKDPPATGRKEPWINGWLPADGLAVFGQFKKEFSFDPAWQHFSTDIKWSLGSDHDEEDASGPTGDWRAGVFLAHVMLMARAEAAAHGAKVTKLGYSHPSSFPKLLESNLHNRWSDLLRDTGIEDGGSEVEASAVADYLTDYEGAAAAVGLLAIDIGGSTSDIAIWQHNQPRCLESVRFAASAISAWLCRNATWSAYCRVLDQLGLEPDNWATYGSGAGKLADIPASDRMPFLYISFAEIARAQRLSDLLNELSRKTELRRFLAHISFIFAGLLYYLGQLQRGLVGDEGEHPAHGYTIHFCGKGATFLHWLEPDGEWPVLEDIFRAGLVGPGGTSVSVPVSFKMSQRPKHEVGHGRLIRALKLKSGASGTDRRSPRPVRVAEAGYCGLTTHDELSVETLEDLIRHGPQGVPSHFAELETFLLAWSHSRFGGSRLQVEPAALHAHVVQRIYGHVRGCIAFQLADEDRRHELTIDPLFLLECKAFYELATGVKPELWIGKVTG